MAGTRKTAVAVVLAALALTATACNDNADKGADKNAAPAAPTPAAATTPAGTPSAAPTGGAKPEKASPAVYLEQVTQKTGAAKSAKITETITIGDIAMKGTGAISWADGLQGDLTMDMSGSPLGKGIALLTGSESAPYRFTKDGMYLRVGGDAVQVLDGKHWVHYSAADQAKASGGTANQFKDADPVEGVRLLIATGKVAEVGEETVAGKATTHYSGVLNADDIAKASGKGLSQEKLDGIKQKLAASGITSERIDVWVDTDQLVVQRTETGDTSAGAFKASVLYSDYGTAVNTTAPAASDVVEASALAKLSKGGGAS
ncbi:hypothetical protein [Streptomyces sp. CBMA156]|uniref:hypothetical protein n=1 Tax=Streptomyces sp. CBMA156 TaxID=1930280 RepID=UPI001661D7F6|nr:hypothetical protein [Streptomyces sp. CBMA156]MBD0669853.1 hypothetical protein [Streptomyces sp. CBMA156]